MKDIDDIFRKRLRDFEADPDDALWHKIRPFAPKNASWWNRHKVLALAVAMIVVLFGVHLSPPSFVDTGIRTAAEVSPLSRNREKLAVQNRDNRLIKPKSAERSKGVAYKTPIVALPENLLEAQPVARSWATVAAKIRPPRTGLSPTSGSGQVAQVPVKHTAGIIAYEAGTLTANQSKETASEPLKVQFESTNLQGSPFRRSVFGQTKPDVVYNLPPSLPAKKPDTKLSTEWFGSVMPLFSYVNVRPLATDQTFVSQVQAPAALSADRMGVRVQAGAQVWLSKRFSARFGLSLSQQNSQFSYFSTDNNVQSVLVETLDNQKIKVTPLFKQNQNTWVSKQHYAGLTASGQYWLKKGVVSHFVGAGGEIYGSLGPKIADRSAVSAVLKVSYGITKPIGPHLHLNVEPTFTYGLTSQFVGGKMLEVRPYNYGFNVGLLWKP